MSSAPARPSPSRRRGLSALVLAALTAALLTLTAGPAMAHDELVDSDPADGSTVAALPEQISTTWSATPDARFATMTVVGPDGARYDAAPATVQGDRVVVGLRPGPAGAYRVGYRIVSDDGHPVAGATTFTATAASPGYAPAAAPAAGTGTGSAAPAGDPQPTPSNAASAAPAPDPGSGGVPVWVIVLGAVVVVGAALAFTLRRRA